MIKCQRAQKNNNSGFTLVELIVVLVILGILASVAVYGISGYIDMTRFNKNEENALSVFQSAQSAINHMSEAGTLEKWAENVTIIGDAEPKTANGASSNPGPGESYYDLGEFNSFIADDARAGQSVHMRYIVTYTPSPSNSQEQDQNNLIKTLIGDDFKQADIFNALITIEFDIEKYIDYRGNLHYSADVYGVFYDNRRTSWGDALIKNGTTLTVPFRDREYRRTETLIGYSNGTVTAVDTVVVPSGKVLGQTLFTLRNGETLDLTWSATSEGEPVTGVPSRIHYTFTLYNEPTKTRLCDIVVSENSIISGIPSSDMGDNYFDALQFNPGLIYDGMTDTVRIDGKNYSVLYTKENVTDEKNTAITIYKASIETVAKAYVHIGSDITGFNYDNLPLAGNDGIQNNLYSFPLTITYEIHEGDGISPRISYSLSLDAMMDREAFELDNAFNQTLNYDISRLFSKIPGHNGNQANAPFNISATMSVSPDNFTDDSLKAYKETSDDFFISSETIYARRAYDDPVYLQADGSYKYSDVAAKKDGEAGHAVVNTYFGDLGNGSLSAGTSSSDAVITSFRHLYNIRMLESYAGAVNYKISRDLNWYTISGSTCSSDVKVYKCVRTPQGGGFKYSIELSTPLPVEYGFDHNNIARLRVVSFPAIPVLNQISTLKASDNSLSSEADKTSRINNLQLRLSSFDTENDEGFGLVCSNRGTISNIRINSLSLMLCENEEGISFRTADLSLIQNSVKYASSSALNLDTNDCQKPVGGLIGNNIGTIGADGETISINNSYIIAGNWNGSSLILYGKTSACGGIIGANDHSTDPDSVSAFGNLQLTGTSGVIGNKYVGGIIGYNNANINALLKVSDDKLTIDKALFVPNDSDPTFVIAGRETAVGGAIAYSDSGKYFSQSNPGTTHSVDQTSGTVEFTFTADSAYAIDVTLTDKAFVINKSGNCNGVGGAVGQIYGYPNKILSIKVNNAGTIINNANALGGAVGFISGGSSSQLFISSSNSGLIGTYDGVSIYGTSTGTGGAIGRIENFGNSTDIIRISAENKSSGRIFGHIDSDTAKAGVGGAIGSVATGSYINPIYIIKSENSGQIHGYTPRTDQTTEVSILNNYNLFGVGGAVGLFERVPHASAVYCVMKENSSVESDGNNAGGSVGCQRLPMSQEQANNQAGISGSTQTFTYFTADLYDGASVTADFFNAGGAAGNICDLNCNTRVRARIMSGSVNVRAMGNAGGATGRFVQTNSIGSAGSYVALEGNDTTPILNVRSSATADSDPVSGNENVGGLVGLSGSTVDLTAALVMPAQTGSDLLTLKVDGYSNTGGVVGQMRGDLIGITGGHKNLSIPTLMVTLNAGSYVKAYGNNSGGAIGLLTNIDTLSTIITVSAIDTDESNNVEISASTGNCGGCIGDAECSSYFKILSNMTVSGSYLSLSGNSTGSQIGGCIGNVKSLDKFDIIGNISTEVNNLTISGNNNIGGCIGNAESGNNFAITGNLSVKNTSGTIKISGNSFIGGCIGNLRSINDKSIFKITGTISTLGTGITISGNTSGERVGGCVGNIEFKSNNDNGKITGDISYNCSASSISGGNYVGGVIGCSEFGFYNKNLLYTAKNGCSITGKDYVGGMMGYAHFIRVEGTMKLNVNENSSTSDTFSISGENYVGGCLGCIEGIYTYTNQNPNPACWVHGMMSVTINNTYASISGSGSHVGGVTGFINHSQYSKSSVTLNNSSTLNISSGNDAGGLIGGMDGMIIGPGSGELKIYCNKNSHLYVTGVYAAGGLVGYNNGRIGVKGGNTVIKAETNESTVHIIATGENAGAGGLIGINAGAHARNENTTINVCSGSGTMYISAENGYVGGVSGINDGLLGEIDGSWRPKASNPIKMTYNLSHVVLSSGTTDNNAVGRRNPTAGQENYNIAP